jgi:hypothetical protein
MPVVDPTVRIADALEALVRHADANYLLTKVIAEEQKAHYEETQRILTEELSFRREQAAKSEQQQATFLQMFLGAAQPQPVQPSPPHDAGQAFPPTARARRPRHTEPT